MPVLVTHDDPGHQHLTPTTDRFRSSFLCLAQQRAQDAVLTDGFPLQKRIAAIRTPSQAGSTLPSLDVFIHQRVLLCIKWLGADTLLASALLMHPLCPPFSRAPSLAHQGIWQLSACAALQVGLSLQPLPASKPQKPLMRVLTIIIKCTNEITRSSEKSPNNFRFAYFVLQRRLTRSWAMSACVLSKCYYVPTNRERGKNSLG